MKEEDSLKKPLKSVRTNGWIVCMVLWFPLAFAWMESGYGLKASFVNEGKNVSEGTLIGVLRYLLLPLL